MIAPPILILFSGPPCAWKSTLAARLSSKTGITYLEMDQVRMRLLPEGKHTRPERVITLSTMHFAAELLLRHGADVILDAQYRRPEDRQAVRAVVDRTGARLVLIECIVSPEEAVRRFDKRGPDAVRLDLTRESVYQMALEFVYSREGLVLDTERLSVDECFALVESLLIEEIARQ